MILSLHYTTNGKAVLDRTKIGFTVAKTPPRKKFVMQQAGEDTPVTAPSRPVQGPVLFRLQSELCDSAQ
jgi:hypothetical protein